MDHDEFHPTPPSSDAAPTSPDADRPPPPKALMLGAGAILCGFIVVQGPVLWGEWRALQSDWQRTRQTKPIGYPGISPNPSFAQPPTPWIREDGAELLLWSGWKHGQGHQCEGVARRHRQRHHPAREEQAADRHQAPRVAVGRSPGHEEARAR